jgi:type VI secretion system secreted protein VgrG
MDLLSDRIDVRLGERFFSQHRRLLTIETALPNATLVVERMTGREAVNECFEFDVLCLSTCAHLDIAALAGEQVTLRLACADGAYRPWHGCVGEIESLGADGGNARYSVQLVSWLRHLQLRHDSYVFQNATAQTVIETVFRDYPSANFRFEVTEPLRVRSLCVQHNETDYAFVTRLLAEEGLSFHFEHLDGDAAKEADEQGHARHVMVITDRQAERQDLGTVRYSLPDVRGAQGMLAQIASVLGAQTAAQTQDTVSEFAASRRIGTNAVTLGSWDYARVAGVTGQTESSLDLGDLPTLEAYDGAGAYRYESAEHAARAAELRLQAHELAYKTCDGRGYVRTLAAGRTFTLIDHPHYGANSTALNYRGALTAERQRPDNQFVVLSVEHEAANNLDSEAARLRSTTDVEPGSYRNRFVCAAAAAAVVPKYERQPTARGETTALVVGIDGEPVTTDREHRVKVQFHWQRGKRPNDGGLSSTSPGGDPNDSNAPGNESSSTWVRVTEALAGPNWGAQFTPRVGTEVLIGFIEGDADRPVVLEQIHNGQDEPPFSAGIDSGANHPGTVSGIHAPTLDRGGYAQWIIDDAAGQLRTQLRVAGNNVAHTSFSLGYLIQQNPSSAQRGAWRGTGFEASTDGWATLRAAQGVLLTTAARPNAAGTQMDAAEALALARGATDLGQRLSQAATTAQALKLAAHDANCAHAQQIKCIDPQQDGKYNGPVEGQEAKKPNPGTRDLADPVETFAKPLVVLHSASSTALTTDASIAAFAGQDQSYVAQNDTHLTAAHTASAASGETTSLFTQSGGIQAIAANGPVSIRAHTDALEIKADQSIKVTSSNDSIRVQANQKIELLAGQSSVVLEGANITFTCPGAFTVKAAQHAWAGGGGNAASLPNLPSGTISQAPHELELNYVREDLTPLPGYTYKVVFEDGSTRTGQLDGNGHALLQGVPAGPAQIYFGESPKTWTAPRPQIVSLTDEGMAADLRKIGLDPDTVDLQALIEAQAGRTH